AQSDSKPTTKILTNRIGVRSSPRRRPGVPQPSSPNPRAKKPATSLLRLEPLKPSASAARGEVFSGVCAHPPQYAPYSDPPSVIPPSTPPSFLRSDRLNALPPFLFDEIDRKKRERIAAGADVINLGVGDPDKQTPEFVVEAMNKAMRELVNQQYPAVGGGLGV